MRGQSGPRAGGGPDAVEFAARTESASANVRPVPLRGPEDLGRCAENRCVTASFFTLEPGTPVVDRFGRPVGRIERVLVAYGEYFDGVDPGRVISLTFPEHVG